MKISSNRVGRSKPMMVRLKVDPVTISRQRSADRADPTLFLQTISLQPDKAEPLRNHAKTTNCTIVF